MKKQLAAILVGFSLTLAACGNDDKEMEQKENHGNMEDSGSHDENMDGMDHNSSGEVTKGLVEAKDPAFKNGDPVIVNADHMPGMKGAKGTIKEAYDTTVYMVSYTPTTGGKRVEGHKWLIHGEIKDAGDKPYKAGDKVTLEASHMKGMKGAEAVIDEAKETTVYVIDYTPTTGGKEVKNHKWVTEDELSAE